MAESKHGGSPVSGLVAPAGLGTERLAPGALHVLEPAISEELRKREERKRQFERRRLGLELLSEQVAWQGVPDDGAIAEQVHVALKLADELIKQTGGEV
jgi:hypothetical protein